MECVHTYTEQGRKNYDPSHTTSLRAAFVSDVRRRFNELIRVIKIGVDKNDCFGLKENVHTLQMTPIAKRAFSYPLSQKKVTAFMKWLQSQVDSGILTVRELEQVGTSVDAAWTNLYIYDSYKRGVMRARTELIKAGYNTLPIEETGGIEASMGTPFHLDRVGLAFIRAFSELKGITASMDTIISRILAQGIADGDGPALLARKLVAAINGEGIGDLGLTDTLGRYISPIRRAEMMARTEIIRSFHVANIQEMRNWGVLGIIVKGEWRSAGDSRVCEICESLEGQIFTLDEIEGMIPVHPNCFIDHQIPVYTSEGWKRIGDIKIGDYVLTHKRRFRKVYALPRHKAKSNVVTFNFNNYIKLSITANHPILDEHGIWKEAGEYKTGDKIMMLGNVCKRCGKSIPYFKKYCSVSCLSKMNTEKQWANPEHRKTVSYKNRISMNEQYASGKRDKFAITKKANEKTRLMVKDGSHPFMQPESIAKMIIATHTPELNKMHSERMKVNNPMNDPLVVQKVQESLKQFFIRNPEVKINNRMANHRWSGEMFSSEKKMAEILDKLGVKYVYQHPILKYKVDFAIPSLKIVIECDGNFWHQDKEKDKIRQNNIENEGWFVLRYSEDKINKCFEEVSTELIRVLCNHYEEFELCVLPIEKIKRWTLKKERPLYNLSVEEDESYIAKGVVVHNCRCIALPVIIN